MRLFPATCEYRTASGCMAAHETVATFNVTSLMTHQRSINNERCCSAKCDGMPRDFFSEAVIVIEGKSTLSEGGSALPAFSYVFPGLAEILLADSASQSLQIRGAIVFLEARSLLVLLPALPLQARSWFQRRLAEKCRSILQRTPLLCVVVEFIASNWSRGADHCHGR